MDRIAALSVLAAALVLLAGCQAPTSPAGEGTVPPTQDGSEVRTSVTAISGIPETSSSSPSLSESPPSPAASSPSPSEGGDRLGWEDGYGYNDSLAVNASDGLNGTELDAVVARAMARVEHLRRIEFEETVPVSVISREEYRERYGGSGRGSAATRTFDNARFEALFLVGEDADSMAVRNRNLGSVIAGFYSPGRDEIVLVASGGTLTVNEPILGHELVHALQYRHLDAGELRARTREGRTAIDGLIEGDARYVDIQYSERCEGAWSCVRSGGGGTGGDVHFGLYYHLYFPYSDGPVFVEHFYEQGEWDRVNELYRSPPESTEQVIHPEKYRNDHPREVALPDRSMDGWDRVERPVGLSYDSLGQPSIAAMFAYPTFHPRAGLIVSSSYLMKTEEESSRLRAFDPFNYGFDYADGWDGDTFRVYENGENETAYVWRIVWDSRAEAREFAEGYRKLLAHWGGERANGSDGVWRIPEDESAFADAFAIRVRNDTVTIVNGPTTGDLPAVHAPVGS